MTRKGTPTQTINVTFSILQKVFFMHHTHKISPSLKKSPLRSLYNKLFYNKFLASIKAMHLVASLCLWALFLAPITSMAAGPDHLSLQSFTVIREQGQLTLHAPVDIEPREAMRHMLRDGAQVLLTCTVKLERQRSLLPSSTVATSTAAMTLSYDPLSRQYILAAALPENFEDEDFEHEDFEREDLKESTTPEQNTLIEEIPAIKPETQRPSFGHRDFNTLMDSTLGRLRIPLCSTDVIDPDEAYFTTIRVTLRHTKVPPWLSQTLFFWSWDVVPSIEFSQTIRGD